MAIRTPDIELTADRDGDFMDLEARASHTAQRKGRAA